MFEKLVEVICKYVEVTPDQIHPESEMLDLAALTMFFPIWEIQKEKRMSINGPKESEKRSFQKIGKDWEKKLQKA